MKRGNIWTVAGGTDYAGKPRPAVIVQDDSFSINSITVCIFTSTAIEAPLLRPLVEPSARNGLRTACRLMVDKISTVPRSKLGIRIGRLEDEDIDQLNQAMLVFFGLTASSQAKDPA
ncbi:mRNA interferase PemK [Azorhizobium oxalatiphilum]|uniref:mRNA interferase PemK n=1 Tax=Azorhizobium oxalatiphilum TaxID=980631 RepID=A0A917BJ06_9HYPH|nr:type II toxin-antitoxin system PemK/MazF family toxin [Azorhizobium oxalatiphilum]GGF45502.1 mRNA interferase PemK [Azorhizobium oxalatiphilum]